MPRTEEQNKEIKEQTRAKIVDAAFKVFSEKGYQAASISQIATAAGMAKGALYHYFKNKEELLGVVVQKGLEEVMAMIMFDSEMDAKERFKRILDVTFESIETNKEYWKLYMGLISQSQSVPLVSNIFDPYFEGMIKEISQILAEMGVVNPEEEAYILGGMIDGVVLHYLFMGEGYPIEKVKQNIIGKYVK